MPHSLCISWTSPSFPWSTSAEIAKNKTTLSYPELEKYIIEYKRTSSENYLFHSSNNSGYRIKFTTYSPLVDIPPTSRPRACSSAWKCAMMQLSYSLKYGISVSCWVKYAFWCHSTTIVLHFEVEGDMIAHGQFLIYLFYFWVSLGQRQTRGYKERFHQL